MKLGTRLVLSYLALILVGMGILIPLTWLAVERLYVDTQKANLLAQARELAARLALELPPGSGPAPYSQMSNILPGIHSRVIDPQGTLVIDLGGQPGALSEGTSPVPAGKAAGVVTLEEMLSRPEVVQARGGSPAATIRRVEAAGGRRVLYAAAPVLAGDGQPAQVVYLATPLPDTRWLALPTGVRWQFIAFVAAAGLLASAAGLLLAGRIARPLGSLAGAAHAVAAGDLNQTVPEDEGIAELTTLGQAFNRMTANLRSADKAKNAFIADVSHELRTPLTVIKGTIETLQDGAIDDLAARGPFLDAMSRETERLIRLVSDLLVLTRADAGALNLQPALLDLGELARSRCEHLKRPAGKRQVRLEVAPSAETGAGCLVWADADRVAQVLDNLLDNAIRYSPPGGVVQVALERDNGQVACRVSDSGPGIPAEHLPWIFERFYRADPARGRSQGGSGLGLAIVRGLVTAHGGRVAAASREGQGTTVTFWLPAAPDR